MSPTDDGLAAQGHTLPAYDDLPPAPAGGRSAWGLFGPDDSVGLLNLVTPDVTRAAAALVRTGKVFALDLPLTFFDPPLFGRSPVRVENRPAADLRAMDEVYHGFNPQSGSQWDALCHVGYDLDAFYNGATMEDVLERGRAGVSHWGARGIATRGVLLDLRRSALRAGADFDPGSAHTFSVDDLERARVEAGVAYRPGDVIVLHTGFVDWYSGLDAAERTRIAPRSELAAAGLEHTEAMARYLWDTHAVGVAGDAPSVEVWPMDTSAEAHPFGVLHRMLLGQFGMALGELWNVGPLAAWCAESGRHEFFLSSAPFNMPGGAGSPANALAIV